ncbi:hypothetical protein CJ030_MR1G027489 [Morella rubra]|uniref:Uncharacterized protein n=1 Tax=Morella rubra TaxID=262757 RepID=A0A6A1WS67_9ROSI|nr:hypothetical protein CJ030_MR1G027489 [Morella rubra]
MEPKDNEGLFPARESAFVEEIESRHVKGGSRILEQEVNVSHGNTTRSSRADSVKKNHRTRNQELRTSVQELASQAASPAKAEAAKNITPPNSAYQFEVSWRELSGDSVPQVRLLKYSSICVILFTLPNDSIYKQFEEQDMVLMHTWFFRLP